MTPVELVSSLLVFLYVAFSAVAYFVNLEFGEALTKFVGNGVLFLAAFVAVLFSSKLFSVKQLVKPFLLGSFVVVGVSLLVLLGYKPTYYHVDDGQLSSYLELHAQRGIIGFSGVYLNQNQFAITLLCALLLSSLMMISFKQLTFLGKLGYCTLICVSVLFSLATLTRSLMLVIFIVFLLFFLKGALSKRVLMWSLIVAGFLGICFFVMYDVVILLLGRVGSDGLSSRDIIWVDALNSFYANPYFGVGYYVYHAANGVTMSAHNLYIHMLASLGFVPSFFIFMYFILVVLVMLKKIIFLNFREGRATILLALSTLGVLIHQLFEVSLMSPLNVLTIFFFLISAMVFNGLFDVRCGIRPLS